MLKFYQSFINWVYLSFINLSIKITLSFLATNCNTLPNKLWYLILFELKRIEWNHIGKSYLDLMNLLFKLILKLITILFIDNIFQHLFNSNNLINWCIVNESCLYLLNIFKLHEFLNSVSHPNNICCCLFLFFIYIG